VAEPLLHASGNAGRVYIPEYGEHHIVGHGQSTVEIEGIFPCEPAYGLLRSRQIIPIRVLEEIMLTEQSGYFPLPTLVDPLDGEQGISPLFLDLLVREGGVDDHVREDLQALFEILLEDRYAHVKGVPPRPRFDASPDLLHLLGDP